MSAQSDNCDCCVGPTCNSNINKRKDCKMVLEKVTVIYEGYLEKKIVRKRIPFGTTWKQKYCVLNSEAIIIYGSKRKKINNSAPSRTIPFCHIRSVTRLSEEDLNNKLTYFNILTEQNDLLSFRCEQDKGWEAQIQIQLIQFKNRQDILRYKQITSHVTRTETDGQNLGVTSSSNDVDRDKQHHTTSSNSSRTIILPNCKSKGIGITVIPLSDGRIVVNRVLDGGPAMKIGGIQPRDQILSANDKLVTSVEMLSEIVRNSPESVTLLVKPRNTRSSPIVVDPKHSLKHKDNCHSQYIDQLATDEGKNAFEKGFAKGRRRGKGSPKHFLFM